MTKIAIVGAGQSGGQLALGLQKHGYDVTLLTNRTPEDIRNGKVMSSQCMFHDSLETERELGINFWEDEVPDVDAIGLTVVGPEGKPVIEWEGALDEPAQAVDQRVKFPRFMEEFKQRGGDLRIADVGIAELEELTDSYDLVIVASGKGEITRAFERDPDRSPYDQPMRALALTYVTDMGPKANPINANPVNFNLIPTVGEYFGYWLLTTTGPAYVMVFEGIPGGPMDCWSDVNGPEEHLARSKELLNQLLPWEGERTKNAQLTDPNGILVGRFAPTVRKPVMTLPSGRVVWGMADTVVLNDPITGQGSNNAAKCAHVYLKAILEHGDGPFERDWMEATFERYWDYAQYVTQWTNMLLGPPPEHIVNLLGAAGQIPSLARRIANGFNNPPDFFPWWTDPEQTNQLIAREAEGAAA